MVISRVQAASSGGDTGRPSRSIRVKHRTLMLALEECGLGIIDQTIHLVASPLLRATHSGGRVLTPMPFLASSTYDHLKTVFALSYEMANPPGDPDPEWDLQGHAVPRLANHSWRRYADKKAKENFAKLVERGLSKMDIDLYMGWNLAEYSKDMQEKYAGQQRATRVKRRFITGYC